MEKRSKKMKIESDTNAGAVVHCRVPNSNFGRKKSKKKSKSSGGKSVDCSGLNLVRLDDIITDLRIGGFVRVKTSVKSAVSCSDFQI